MMVTGAGWLTFIAPPVASRLLPVNLAAGVTGEATMIVWLLARGVDQSRWLEFTTAAVPDTFRGPDGAAPFGPAVPSGPDATPNDGLGAFLGRRR
jgi:hypothetical protein